MGAAVRQFVRARAGNRCEYCRLPQEAYDLTFHVDHVVASQHHQDDTPSNLALACDRCNLHKGTNLAAIDPETGDTVPVFNPRTDSWDDHFALVDAEVMGTTPTGRATARLLAMNSERRLLLRKRLLATGAM
jgi:5-methylcytosine-specific restriction endonuclease McrA